MTTQQPATKKSGCSLLGVLLVLFCIAFLGIGGLIVKNIFTVGSVAVNAIEQTCSGNVEQGVITFTSKYTGEDGELLANTSNNEFAQIIGHPCEWKPDIEVLKRIYFDATNTYGAIVPNQPSYVEYVSDTIYGQPVLMVSAVKPLTPAQAEKLQGLLAQGKVDADTLAEVLEQ